MAKVEIAKENGGGIIKLLNFQWARYIFNFSFTAFIFIFILIFPRPVSSSIFSFNKSYLWTKHNYERRYFLWEAAKGNYFNSFLFLL